MAKSIALLFQDAGEFNRAEPRLRPWARTGVLGEDAISRDASSSSCRKDLDTSPEGSWAGDLPPGAKGSSTGEAEPGEGRGEGEGGAERITSVEASGERCGLW